LFVKIVILGDAELADTQDADKAKELAHVRTRAQEELMVKMYKMKNEHEEHTRKMLDDHGATIHRLEAQVCRSIGYAKCILKL
jgi:hypothetical protein